MEYQEAVVGYRERIAKLFAELEPRPSEEWIAEQVDHLWPLSGGAPTHNGRPLSHAHDQIG
jgi:hypothetical protein